MIQETLKKSRLVVAAVRGYRHFVGSFRLRAQLARVANKRIVLGAEGVHQRGWIPTDQEVLDLLKDSDWQKWFAPGSIDAMLAEHVWEHLTPEQGRVAAKQCFTYLKPSGYLRIAVPDGLHPDPEYVERVRVGGSGAGAHDHKVLYTYRTLSALFEAAGFQVELREYFDESHQFHYRDWSPEQGLVHRSKRFDSRNAGGALNYTSIILDAIKPPDHPAEPPSKG